MTDGNLNFDVRLITRGFISGLRTVGDGLGRLKGVLGSIASLAGVAFGTKELIESAAALNAQMSQITQTFGELESAARSAVQRVADASGILEDRLLATGTQIYAFAKTSGMDSVTALSMMEDALTVAADSAAYYDRSLEDVSATLQSFLKGNYANDAALGLSATETTRNAAAMKLYGVSFGQLSEAQKQLTLLQMVKDANRLSGAMGQAAREAEGWENVLGNLKAAFTKLFAVIGQPVLRFATNGVQLLTAKLTELTHQAEIAVNTLNRLFGWESDSAKTAASIAGSIADSIEEQEALTDAVNETAEAQENYLAGFDKITKLGDVTGKKDKADDTVTQAVVPELSDGVLVQSAQEAADKVQEIFQGLLDVLAPLQAAWEKYGDSIQEHLENNFNNIGTHIRSMIDTTMEWAAELDWGPLLKSFDGLLGALEPLTEDIGAGLEWLWTEVLLPLGKWTIEEALPASIDVLSGALDALSAVVDAVKPGLQEFWDKVLKPILDRAGEITIEGLEKLSGWLHNLADWIREHPNLSGFLLELAAAIGILYAAINGGAVASIAKFITAAAALDVTVGVVIAGILSWIYVITELHDNWDDICDVFEESGGVLGFLAGWIEYATEDVEAFFSTTEAGEKWLTFWEGLGEKVYDGIHGWWDAFEDFGEKVYDITEALKKFLTKKFQESWENVIKPFMPIGEWFRQKWEFIRTVYSAAAPYFKKQFEQARTNVKNAFMRIGEWFCEKWNTVKSVYDAVSGYFKKQFENAYTNVKNAFSDFDNWFRQKWDSVKSVYDAVSGYFKEQFDTAYSRVRDAFSGAESFFNDLNDKIRAPFRSIADWFRDTFSQAWRNVLDVFSRGGSVFEGIKSGISDTFKNTVNGLIGGINNVLHKPFEAINGALNGLRNWELGTPWGNFRPFLWLPNVNIPEIPRLAQGTAIPANYGEFLAVLGDNKREPEVVSPVSTIKQAVREALSEIGRGQGGDIHLQVDLDGKTVYRNVVRRNQESIRMTGRNPLNPGVIR